MPDWTADKRFWQFLVGHIKRCHRADWPAIEAGSEFWVSFRVALQKRAVTETEAADASQAMHEAGVSFPGDHAKAFLGLVDEARARRMDPGGPEHEPREVAEARSLSCPDCEGKTGLAIRHRHLSARPADPTKVVFYCTCPLGRWNKARAAAAPRLRNPDLADYPDLQLRDVPWSEMPDNPHRYPAEEWDAAAGRPRASRPYRASENVGLARKMGSSSRAPRERKSGGWIFG